MVENSSIRTYETAEEAKKNTTYNAVLKKENYLIVSKYAFEKLSANEAIILSYLLDLENFYSENNKLNHYGYFYVIAKKVGEDLGICSGTVNTAINKFVKMGLFSEHKDKDNIRYIKSKKSNVINFIQECKDDVELRKLSDKKDKTPWELDGEYYMNGVNIKDAERENCIA